MVAPDGPVQSRSQLLRIAGRSLAVTAALADP